MNPVIRNFTLASTGTVYNLLALLTALDPNPLAPGKQVHAVVIKTSGAAVIYVGDGSMTNSSTTFPIRYVAATGENTQFEQRTCVANGVDLEGINLRPGTNGAVAEVLLYWQ